MKEKFRERKISRKKKFVKEKFREIIEAEILGKSGVSKFLQANFCVNDNLMQFLTIPTYRVPHLWM